MRALLFLAPLFLSACLDEDEVCTTHDGLSCDEAMATITQLQSDLEALQEQLDAFQCADCLTQEDLEGYVTEEQLAELDDRVGAIETDQGTVVRLLTEDPGYGTIEDADSLLEVLEDLDGYRIARDVTVTLSLAAATFDFGEPLTFSHPDGDRIHVEGAGVNNTYLQFDKSEGVIVQGGTALGHLSDLTLVGGSEGDEYGLRVRESSSLDLGDLAIQGFAGGGVVVHGNSNLQLDEGSLLDISLCGHGLLVSESAHANVDATSELDGIQVSDCDHEGLYAYAGAIEASGADAMNNGEAGFTAERGGLLFAEDSEAEGNGTYGYKSLHGAYLNASRAKSLDHAYGYQAGYGATIYAVSSEATKNTYGGYYATVDSFVHATNSIVSGSEDQAYRSFYSSYIHVNGADGDHDYEGTVVNGNGNIFITY